MITEDASCQGRDVMELMTVATILMKLTAVCFSMCCHLGAKCGACLKQCWDFLTGVFFARDSI